MQNRVFDDGVVFLSAEDDSNGGVVPFPSALVVIHANIHVHLAHVLVSKFTGFKVKKDKTFQKMVVENEVKKKSLVSVLIRCCRATKANPFPSSNKNV